MCAPTVPDARAVSQLPVSPPLELPSRTVDGPPRDAAAGAGWPAQRWLTILDRTEFRQVDVGLRYSGPPLWLEVTMTGPDSDSWPAATDDDLSWDWQSLTPCPEVEDLIAGGAGDDALLAAVSRYTIENLILNAVHEVGEWFRLDGHRVFPAHVGSVIGHGQRDVQGNGAVEVRVGFGESTLTRATGEPGDVPAGEEAQHRLAARIATATTPPRFTYLPGTAISIESAGPTVRTQPPGAATTWRSAWSPSTTAAADSAPDDVMALVVRDVHRALVLAETDRICRAFHIDGRRAWRLSGPKPPFGAEPRDDDPPSAHALFVSIRYDETCTGLLTGIDTSAASPRGSRPSPAREYD